MIKVSPGLVGLGLFATRDILSGECILEFQGSIISFDDTLHMGSAEANPLQIGRDKYINIEPPGVYANHSCVPNAGIFGDTKLTALMLIRAHSEIFYDYSTTMDEDSWTMQCCCNEKECRGIVTDFKYLPASIREKYLQLGIVQKFIARKF